MERTGSHCRERSLTGGMLWPVAGLVCLAVWGFRLPAQGPVATPPAALLGDPLPARPEAQPRAILPAAAQAPFAGQAEREETEIFHPALRLDLPGPQILFRLESEEQLRERLRQEAKQRPGGVARGRLEFPDDRMVLTREVYQPRMWPAQAEIVEPYYVGYRRLYFNQINLSRYGWDLGVLAPFISTGTFFIDFASLPYQFVSEPCRRWEYNTGYPLPGTPVPLLLYPPKLK
jgi:hypothetical protein